MSPPRPPPPSKPLVHDTILTGVTATDVCPQDPNYSDTNNAFDGDFNTAWVCTRAKNQDGQDSGRLSPAGGVDSSRRHGIDSAHAICPSKSSVLAMSR
jgi:hypothetical protein